MDGLVDVIVVDARAFAPQDRRLNTHSHAIRLRIRDATGLIQRVPLEVVAAVDLIAAVATRLFGYVKRPRVAGEIERVKRDMRLRGVAVDLGLGGLGSESCGGEREEQERDHGAGERGRVREHDSEDEICGNVLRTCSVRRREPSLVRRTRSISIDFFQLDIRRKRNARAISLAHRPGPTSRANEYEKPKNGFAYMTEPLLHDRAAIDEPHCFMAQLSRTAS